MSIYTFYLHILKYFTLHNIDVDKSTLFIRTHANVESFGYCNDEERVKM